MIVVKIIVELGDPLQLRPTISSLKMPGVPHLPMIVGLHQWNILENTVVNFDGKVNLGRPSECPVAHRIH